jgi:HK97 family phage major capsid protein/HK97 family phage prohead protease
MHRAYSLLDIKSVDDDARVLEGIASTPEPDRVGDILEPKGAQFRLPLPLLWQHRHDQPIGQVLSAQVTDAGIRIKAQIAKDVLPRIDEAWALIRSGLVRGLSVGFRAVEPPEPIDGTYGVRFKAWEWLELSAVTVPANSQASISLIRSLDTPAAAGLAALTPAVVGLPVVRLHKGSPDMAKTYTEQIKDFENKRAANVARMDEIQRKALEEGRTKDDAEKEEFQRLDDECKSVDAELVDLRLMEDRMKAAAQAVVAANPLQAAQMRQSHVISVAEPKREPGVGLARAAIAQIIQLKTGYPALELAKQRWPADTAVHALLQHKAAVAAGTTTHALWAGPLVDPTNLTSEFLEFLRPQTIIGKFGRNGVPALRSVPFNIRVTGRSTGGTGYWVGQGAAKPLTAWEFNAQTLAFTKVAAIAVITQELARFSAPSAEMLVRDGLRDVCVERIDIDFVDPGNAGVANVQPASITNGVTALSSAGTTADNVRTDIISLVAAFITANVDPSGLVIIMPNTLALALSILVNSLGQPEFPGMTMNGGVLSGIPVITSQHAANASGAGNLVIAVNTRDVFLADDNEVTIDASTEASLEMDNAPTQSSATPTETTVVSMFQTNSIALRAERFINWAKMRTSAVVYMDDVNWGSVGSP